MKAEKFVQDLKENGNKLKIYKRICLFGKKIPIRYRSFRGELCSTEV